MTDIDEQMAERVCSICSGAFNICNEGGVDGFFGMLPIAFCPTCKAGLLDFADQVTPEKLCSQCGEVIGDVG